MLTQQKAEGELSKLFSTLIGIILFCTIIGYLGYRYFDQIEEVGKPNMQLEHVHFANILGVLRSQWLMAGKPEKLVLDWHELRTGDLVNSQYLVHKADNSQKEWVKMSNQGWPLPQTESEQGCQQLSTRLLGKALTEQILVQFNAKLRSCLYINPKRSLISYDLTSGMSRYVPLNE